MIEDKDVDHAVGQGRVAVQFRPSCESDDSTFPVNDFEDFLIIICHITNLS